MLSHQHLNDQRLRGQAALDDVRGRRGLDHLALAAAAGVLGADGPVDVILHRNDAEAIGRRLADPMKPAIAAGAGQAVRLDHLFPDRQTWRQWGSRLARLSPFARSLLFVRRGLAADRRRFRIDPIDLSLKGVRRKDDVFQRQRQLIRRQFSERLPNFSAFRSFTA